MLRRVAALYLPAALLDVATTVYGIRNAYFQELNPVAARLFDLVGVGVGAVVAYVGVGVVAAALHRLLDRAGVSRAWAVVGVGSVPCYLAGLTNLFLLYKHDLLGAPVPA